MSILLVEDDAQIREGLSDLLDEIGPTTAVPTTQRACAVIAEGHVGLVVTDLNLGGGVGNGREVVAAASQAGVPVIVCSGAGEPEVERLLRGVLASAVLLKPFDGEELLTLARRLLHAPL